MDILAKLIADHRWFYERVAILDSTVFKYAHENYERDWARDVMAKVSALLGEILTRTLRHEELEHELLFPALREHKAVPASVLDDMEEDHKRIHKALIQFIDAVNSPREKLNRDRLLRMLRMVSLIQRHMIREEVEVFDIAKYAIPFKVLEALGERAVILNSVN